MSKSSLTAFRIPAELRDEFEQAIAGSGDDKSSWLVDAVRQKLNRPRAEDEMLALIEQMKKAAEPLIMQAEKLEYTPYEEDALIRHVLQLKREGIQDASVIARRLNVAGFMALEVRWDANNYHHWAGDKRVMGRFKKIQEQQDQI